MPLVETESLVIKSYNLAEADKIVVFLTRDHGVVRGVAKGAKRLKSKFGSGLEPFSVVHVEYFQKDAVELVSLQKIDLIRSNFEVAGNPDFLQKFAYLGEVLISFSPPHDPNETLYRMVKSCVEVAAANHQTLQSVGVYFELWLLRLAGYMPDWTRCDDCRRAFEETEDVSVRPNFHFACTNCRHASDSQVLDAKTRAIASSARRLSPEEFAKFSAESDDELNQLSTVLKRLISHSLGREVAGETSLAVTTQ